MQRVAQFALKRSYTVSSRVAAEAVAASSPTALNITFCTPHAPIYSKKQVNMVLIPGAAGEYGLVAGHSAIISELKPGVVTVIHTSGETEKFFVPGGFAVTAVDSATDISVPEAVPLSDIDEAAVKANYAEAVKAASAAPEGSIAKAVALIEADVYSAMGRAVGVTV
eukprot:gene13025-17457_t